MRFWFTADLHLLHGEILDEQRRPFASLDEMNGRLVEAIDREVRPDDRLYILGDLAWRGRFDRALELVSSLRCRHKHLLLGNHDRAFRGKWEDSGLFEWCGDYLELPVAGFGYERLEPIVLCHYPFMSWIRSSHNSDPGASIALHLHGHVHSDGAYNMQMRDQGIYRYDVGVDANGYAPVSLDMICDFFGIAPRAPR